MKKVLKFFALFLLLPLTFVFGGCKKDKDKSDDDSDTQIEQPVEPEEPGGEDPEDPDEPGTGGEDPDQPGGGEDPENPDEPGAGGEDPEDPVDPDPPTPPAETYFTVSFDYSLPTDYDFLLEDYSVEKNTKETLELPTISDAKLKDYFIGWFDSKTNQQITANISGTANQTKNVYAKWNETDLLKYYYTTGLKFVQGVDYLGNNVAVVSNLETTAETVILPQFVDFDGTELPVRIFAKNSFNNTNVKKIVFNNLEGIMIEDYAFANSKLQSFDFKKVYSIGDYAFNNTKLTGVVLGAFVNEIGDYAFANCSELSSLDMTTATSVNSISAYMCSGSAKLSTVKISSAVKSIENYAFAGCNKLVNVSFLNAVTTIKNYAFANCTGLESVTIPNSVTNLGYNIFAGSGKLATLKLYSLPNLNSTVLADYVGEDVVVKLKKVEILGSSVTEIPGGYFANMTSLEEIVIPNSVESIGGFAFGLCSNLAKLNLPNSLDLDRFSFDSVSDTAWYKNLNEILYFNNDEVLLFVPESVSGEVTVKNGTKVIFDGAFFGKMDVTKVTIPSTVEEIGEQAFYNCSKLHTLLFENNTNLTRIENYTFQDCVNLSSINLTACANLEYIGDFAFSNISQIDAFVIPESVTSFGKRVFSGAKIKAFSVEAGNVNFASVDGVVYDKAVSTLYFYPKLKQDVMFTVPETVTNIKDFAFEYNEKLQNLYIVNNVTIGDGSNSQTNLFDGVFESRIYIYTESTDFGIIDVKQPRVYRILDDTQYEWTDYSDFGTFEITEDPAEILFKRYFVRFVDNDVEYFWHFNVDVSGETILVSSGKNLKNLLK